MATFSSYQHTPFPLDSIFQPDSPISLKNMSGFMEEGFLNNINSCFAQISPPEHANEAALHVEGTQLDRSSKLAAGATSDNEPSSVTKKQSTDQSSTLVDKHESSDKGTHKVTPMDKKRNNNSSWSSLNSAQSKDAREGRSKRQKKSNGEAKEEENKPRAGKKDQKKVPEEPPTGYIHVRARRGQATDSHSLAERVRREKISERMKILQRLVPGCDKVTGKALMLDEIINYVLSLQNQVEFLSMKLASVNPLVYEFGMDPGAFMVRPERLSNIESPLPPMQHCSPTQPTAFVDANSAMATATTVAATACGTENSYPIMDSSLSVLVQGQRPIDFTQDASLLWDLEEQRQKFLNPSWFSNNLSSFH